MEKCSENNSVSNSYNVTCAKVCNFTVKQPLAILSSVSGFLSDDSEYYTANKKTIAYIIYIDGYLTSTIEDVYNFDFFNNMSSLEYLYVGINNENIINYLNALPYVELGTGNVITINIEVTNSENRKNKNKSNSYGFTIQ